MRRNHKCLSATVLRYPRPWRSPAGAILTACCVLPLTYHPKVPDTSSREACLATRGKRVTQDEGKLSPPHFPIFYSSQCVIRVLMPQLPDLDRWSECSLWGAGGAVGGGGAALGIILQALPGNSAWRLCFPDLYWPSSFLLFLDRQESSFPCHSLSECLLHFIYFITLFTIQNIFYYLFAYLWVSFPPPESKL